MSAIPVSPSAPQRAARRPKQPRRSWRLLPTDFAYAREMILPMTLGMLLLLLVLAGNFVYWAINSVVNQGMGIAPILRLFLLSMPGFSGQGIPVGVILGVCLVLNRAVRDNEIIALRVGGASVPRVIAPFLFMALLATFFDWWIVERVAPHTNALAEKAMTNVMKQSAAPLFEDDRYFRAGDYCFYVANVESNGAGRGKPVLHNVMVYVRNSGSYGAFTPQTFPMVYIAQSAQEDLKRPGVWILKDVMQHSYGDNGFLIHEWHSPTVTISLGREISTYWAEQKQPWSLTSDELAKQIADLKKSSFNQSQIGALEVDYYRRRGALPFACFVMALLAAPLALRFARQGSFAGLVCAFGLAFFWQGFDSWLRALGIAGYLPPIVAAWATNALFSIPALFMLWRER